VELALSTLDKKKMAQSWEDKRIKAALLMAPAWAWIFDKEGLKNITIPTYIVASAADQVLFTQNNAGFFSKSIPGAVYQVIPGQVSHYVFIAAPKEKDKIPSNLSFLMADTPGVDREWIQFEVAREAFHFFQSTFSHLPKEK
jgi:predicted dienelactone hydrolase